MPRDDDDYDDRRPRGRRYDDRDDDDYRDDRPRREGGGGGRVGLVIGIVVGIILLCGGGIFGVLFFSVGKVREAAGRAKEMNNLKQMALAAHNVEATHGKGVFAPFAHDSRTAELRPGNSFRVSLLPYIEQDSLYRQFDLTQPWDGARNRTAADTGVLTYRSPLDPTNSNDTPYRAFVGGGALFNTDGAPVPLMTIPDGTANTLMFVTARDLTPWAKPGELAYTPAGPLPALGQPGAKGGFIGGFADGSVRFISSGVPDATLRAMITKAGGEAVDPNW